MEFSSYLRGTEAAPFFGSWTASSKGQFGGEDRKEAGIGKSQSAGAMPLGLCLPPPLSATTTCTLRRPDGIGGNDMWIYLTVGNGGKNEAAQRL